jgi:hypothetical protein
MTVRPISFTLALVIAGWSTLGSADDAPPVAAPPDVAADDDASPPMATDGGYKRHMALGIRLFEDRNFDAAMSEFDQAYELQPGASPLINIALCHKGRFAYVKAIAVLRRALRDHRSSVGDPAKLEKAIAEMSELLGTLAVTVTPSSAVTRLVLDGEVLERTAHIAVGPGQHDLVVRADGFREQRRSFRVASGASVALRFDLVTARGTVVVVSPDASAAVSIDGQPRGLGSVKRQLSPGTHLLELVHGERRYTQSFAVVTGKTTRIVLDDDELLHVGDAPPRGPDLIEQPPVRGFYGLLLTEVGPRFGEFSDLRVAPGLRLGYRVTTAVGIELEFQQVFNIVESSDTSQAVGTTTARANARLMTDSLPARFVTTLGLGYAHDFGYAQDVGTGNGFNFLVEPALEFELSQFILGVALPVVLTLTSLNGGSVSFDIGGGLRAGYGFW